MNEYDVLPGVGAGPVKLGMTREQAREALESAGLMVEQQSRWPNAPDVLFAENSGFQIFFDQQDLVREIELSAPPNASRKAGAKPDFIARYNGLSLFETKATDIVAAIDSPIDGTADRPKLDVSYPALGLLLWRDDDPSGNVEQRAPYFEGILIGFPR